MPSKPMPPKPILPDLNTKQQECIPKFKINKNIKQESKESLTEKCINNVKPTESESNERSKLKPISMRQTRIATIPTISTIPRQEIIRQRPNASFRQKRKEYPLQLEVEGLDQESLKINNITKIYHHNELVSC